MAAGFGEAAYMVGLGDGKAVMCEMQLKIHVRTFAGKRPGTNTGD
jgi:hypothetical protein